MCAILARRGAGARAWGQLTILVLMTGPGAGAQDLALDPETSVATTGEEVAVVWESGGDVVCSHRPPETPPNAFVFDDGNRWSVTTTDGFGLQQGDPTTLTWGIVPDGTDISGFIGEPSGPSDLIAFLDSVIGAGPGGSDLTQRPWFDTFEQIFTAWGELIGARYVYQAADDGAPLGTAAGSAARPDVRIGGHLIDGQSGPNVLAYNFFPNNGDMVIDTSNTSFFGSSSDDFRPLRNTLSHEHGHGLGFDHVCPIGLERLMEPIIDLSFDGPQEDDILMANRGYGDTLEFPDGNESTGDPHSVGSLSDGQVVQVAGVSVDGLSDVDVYAFTVPAGFSASVTLDPTGTTYLSGPQDPDDGSCSAGTSFDAESRNDLKVDLLGPAAQLLASADLGGPGETETLTDFALAFGAGTYFLHVAGGDDEAQMYQLTLGVAEDPEADVSVAKTESFDPAYAGTGLVYTVTVANAGPGAAMGVVVTETLPAGVTLSSTSGCAEDPGGVPTCTLGSIAAGQAASYRVTVSVDHGTSGPLLNEVSVATTSDDPTTGDQQASVTTTAEITACFPNLTLTSSDTASSEIFLAEGTITAGSGYQVTDTDDVRFVAGGSIVLEDGFSVASGGRFAAVVDPLASCPP